MYRFDITVVKYVQLGYVRVRVDCVESPEGMNTNVFTMKNTKTTMSATVQSDPIILDSEDIKKDSIQAMVEAHAKIMLEKAKEVIDRRRYLARTDVSGFTQVKEY